MTISTPAEVQGQSWRWVNSVGYGGAGAAIAVSFVDPDNCTGEGLGCFLLELPLIIAAGGAAGSVVGGYIGDRADRGLGIGEPPGDVHRAALAGGTVLAGATIGVLPAGTVTSRVEPEASPDAFRRSAVILSIAGATAGLVYLGVRWDELTGDEKRRVRLAPIYAPDRGPGLVAGIGL